MAQLRDLIVTGAARFLNNIYGNLIGNASTSDKVNHKLIVNVEGLSNEFDGSSQTIIDIDTSTLKISDAVRLIGTIDTRFTQFTDGPDDQGGTVVNSTTITNAGIVQHAIFLRTVLSNDCLYTTATVDSIQIKYYAPRVGDLVLYEEQEYLCIQANSTQSTWRAMDSSGYWGKYS